MRKAAWQGWKDGMRAIFISYRRTDAEGQAGRLFKDLCDRFGKEAVFIDVVGMKKGLDFRGVLNNQLASCGVMLTIIGKEWLTAADDDGRRRLDDPDDFIRLETAAALKRDIPVIPVLVRGARMPRKDELPEDLKELVFREGVELTHARWESDVRELIQALVPYVELAPGTSPPGSPTPSPLPAPGPFRATHMILLASASALALAVAVGAVYLAYDQKSKAESQKIAAAEEARKADEARKVRQAKEAAAAQQVEEIRKADGARKADEARKVREVQDAAVRKADEARKADEVRKVREAQEAAARSAEEARKADEIRKVPPTKKYADAIRGVDLAKGVGGSTFEVQYSYRPRSPSAMTVVVLVYSAGAPKGSTGPTKDSIRLLAEGTVAIIENEGTAIVNVKKSFAAPTRTSFIEVQLRDANAPVVVRQFPFDQIWTP